MKIGVPKEIKDLEFRVGLTPDGASSLVQAGHEVVVEQGAGIGSGFPDAAYAGAGAQIVERADVWASADLVVKVKEPVKDEPELLRAGQGLFTFLHLAAEPALTRALQNSGARAIAYETVADEHGGTPLLAPMSMVAGRLATQFGAQLLLKEHGGKGLLLGGVPGVMRGKVTILGAGVVGSHALAVARALGAHVELIDTNVRRLARIDETYRGSINTLSSTPANIEQSVTTSDLVIGGVYLQGRRAPTLVPESLIARMEPGSVVVDVAVDQGGCIETIHPTTHSDPTYVVHDVVHYGVSNMPGAVPRTSTLALTNVTLPYVLAMAEHGLEEALRRDPMLASGANVWEGEIVCEGVAEAAGERFRPLAELI